MGKLLWHIIGGILALFLAVKFVPGVTLEIIPAKSTFFGIILTENWQILLVIGVILGLINFFIKPILSKITLPLKILTLGLFGLILNMALIWFLEIMFREFQIMGLWPLFLTTAIVWLINSLLRVKK